MTVIPPFVMRFSTKINAIKHSDQELTEIISLIEKYMIANYGRNIVVKNNQLYFDYIPNYTSSKGPIVKVEKGVFSISFDNNEVVVRYTFSMQESILITLGIFLIVDLIFFIPEKTIHFGFVYGELIVIGIFWLLCTIRERLVFGFIKRKVIEYLGSQVRLHQ